VSEVLRDANLALRFLLELAALAAVAYWGYRSGRTGPLRIALAVAAPLAVATIWILFVAPEASMLLPEPWHLALEVAVFGAAAAVLAVAAPRQGRPRAGRRLRRQSRADVPVDRVTAFRRPVGVTRRCARPPPHVASDVRRT
jgi:hypothetical protein